MQTGINILPETCLEKKGGSIVNLNTPVGNRKPEPWKSRQGDCDVFEIQVCWRIRVAKEANGPDFWSKNTVETVRVSTSF